MNTEITHAVTPVANSAAEPDPRLAELAELAAAEGRPLALAPADILDLEDANFVVDPFAGAVQVAAPMHVTPLGILLASGLVSAANQVQISTVHAHIC